MILLALLLPGVAGLGLWYWAAQRWTRNEPVVIAGAGALVVLILVLVGGLWHQARQLDAAQRDARAAALVRDSLEVEADTLRIHYLAADSARTVAERRALQVALERDSVDELLRTETRVRARVQAQLASVDTTAAAVVTTDSAQPGVRFAKWDLREPPFTIDAAVAVPPAPDSARISLGIQIDPVELTVRLGCEDLPGRPIRAARVSMEGPEWLQVGTLDGEASPDVCNPIEPPPSLLERIRIGAPYAGVGLLGGAIGALILMR